MCVGGWGWGRSLEIPLLSVWTLVGLSLVSSSLSIVLTHVHIHGACWHHGPILTCRGRLAVTWVLLRLRSLLYLPVDLTASCSGK